jgi:hypothetical protein
MYLDIMAKNTGYHIGQLRDTSGRIDQLEL